MGFPPEYTTTRCFAPRFNPSTLKPIFCGHGVLFPLSILNLSVLGSKGTPPRLQQPGGSGITQSIPVLASANVGCGERRLISTNAPAYFTGRMAPPICAESV